MLKIKFILPIIALGLIGGYLVADWSISKYFRPRSSDPQLLTYDFLSALGVHPDYYKKTASGNYLASQFAQNHGDWEDAYSYMQNIINSSKTEDLELQKHAMVLAMASGHINDAVSMGQRIIQADPTNLLAVLFISLDDFKNKNYQGAITTLDSLKDQNTQAFLIPVLKLWAEAAQGKIDAASLPPSSFYAYHAMLIYNFVQKDPSLLNYAMAAYNIDEVDLRDVYAFADMLALADQEDKALKLYQAMETNGFSNEKLEEKITALQNKEDISATIREPYQVRDVTDGAALVFQDMANILQRENSDDSATIFAQMALYLNPNLDPSQIIIGTILARNDQSEKAIESLEKIKPESAGYILAQRQIAELYTTQEDYDKAIQILNKVYKSTDDISTLIQIGDIYRYQDKHAEAVKVYSEVLDHWDNPPDKYWFVYYARGMSYERLKKFEQSELDLKQALAFHPDHPYVLNYLGYSWADQGLNLEESLSMLTKASEEQPQDGYIADSLGWVFYKMRHFKDAIPHLEKAVELLPYDATLNDHLGDAYWQVGRRNEAHFQWERAFNYSEDDEDELKVSLQDKLNKGIDTLKPAPEKALSEAYPKDNGV